MKMASSGRPSGYSGTIAGVIAGPPGSTMTPFAKPSLSPGDAPSVNVRVITVRVESNVALVAGSWVHVPPWNFQ